MSQTAMELDLEEGDAIDVFYDQDGGGFTFQWKIRNYYYYFSILTFIAFLLWYAKICMHSYLLRGTRNISFQFNGIKHVLFENLETILQFLNGTWHSWNTCCLSKLLLTCPIILWERSLILYFFTKRRSKLTFYAIDIFTSNHEKWQLSYENVYWLKSKYFFPLVTPLWVVTKSFHDKKG